MINFEMVGLEDLIYAIKNVRTYITLYTL